MKRNGIEQLPTNGQGPLGICVGRKIEQSIYYMLQHLNQPLHVATLAAAVSVVSLTLFRVVQALDGVLAH